MKILVFAIGVFCLMNSSFAQELSNVQIDTLKGTVGKIRRCATYSINYGSNKPYEEVCVNRLVEVNADIFKAFVPNNRNIVRDLNQIKRCSTYSINDGTNNPYEEVCVNRLVENVIEDLEDMKKP